MPGGIIVDLNAPKAGGRVPQDDLIELEGVDLIGLEGLGDAGLEGVLTEVLHVLAGVGPELVDDLGRERGLGERGWGALGEGGRVSLKQFLENTKVVTKEDRNVAKEHHHLVWGDCRERGSHALCVYPTQDISRMGTAWVKEEKGADTRIIVKE